jgi:nucleolar protein 4
MTSASSSTCFVRNVPTAYDDAKLNDVFAEVGPVKKAFLVREKGSQSHKGLAFVTFGLADDAQQAINELSGRHVDGYKLHVRPVLVHPQLSARLSTEKLLSLLPLL